MIVMVRMLVDSGRLAMWTIAAATSSGSIVGSIAMRPSAWGTPLVILTAISVSASPMSIWPQAMSWARPSRAIDLVRPVIACFVAV